MKIFRYSLLHLLVLPAIFTAFIIPSRTAVLIENLMVEYSKTPLGIDVKAARFSWQMVTQENERGYMQIAYQVVVKNQDGTIVWDTQKVIDNKSIGVKYSGTTLKASTRYTWTVTVWDQNGKPATNTSWFETGLMNPDPGLSAWDGTKWIGGGPDDLVLQSHFLSVFKVKYILQLNHESNSTKAAFILGANDSRLLDKNKNIYNIESKHNGSYIKFELDISSVDGTGSGLAKLNVYRAGYHPDDAADKPLFFAAIPQKLINNVNKYDKHNFFLESVFGVLTVFLESRDNDHKLIIVRSDQKPAGRGGQP